MSNKSFIIRIETFSPFYFEFIPIISGYKRSLVSMRSLAKHLAKVLAPKIASVLLAAASCQEEEESKIKSYSHKVQKKTRNYQLCLFLTLSTCALFCLLVKKRFSSINQRTTESLLPISITKSSHVHMYMNVTPSNIIHIWNQNLCSECIYIYLNV